MREWYYERARPVLCRSEGKVCLRMLEDEAGWQTMERREMEWETSLIIMVKKTTTRSVRIAIPTPPTAI